MLTDLLSTAHQHQLLPSTASGATVPLSAVADITFGAGPNQINRLDRLRVANITAELTGLTLSQATEAVNALPSIKTLPQGVSQQPSGDAESFQELGAGFAFAEWLPALALLAGAVIAGTWVGTRWLHRVDERSFRLAFKAVLTLLALRLLLADVVTWLVRA